jgi:hypothetical protein
MNKKVATLRNWREPQLDKNPISEEEANRQFLIGLDKHCEEANEVLDKALKHLDLKSYAKKFNKKIRPIIEKISK